MSAPGAGRPGALAGRGSRSGQGGHPVPRDPAEAKAQHLQALAVFEDLRSQIGIAHTLCCLGYAEHHLGQAKTAAKHFDKALNLAHQAGRPDILAVYLRTRSPHTGIERKTRLHLLSSKDRRTAVNSVASASPPRATAPGTASPTTPPCPMADHRPRPEPTHPLPGPSASEAVSPSRLVCTPRANMSTSGQASGSATIVRLSCPA